MRPSRPSLLVAALAVGPLSACGADDPAASATITVHAAGSALTAIRHDGAPWRSLALDADGDARVDVDGPYALAVVCDGSRFEYLAMQASADDGDELDLSCPEEVATVTVTAPETQLGALSIGGHVLVAGQSLPIPVGTYDAVLVDRTPSPPRVAIRRGVELTADTELAMDFTSGRVELRPVSVSVSGEPGDVQRATTLLATEAGTSVDLQHDVGGGWLVSSDDLAADDRQRVVVDAFADAGGRRSVSRDVTGDESSVSVELPAGVTAASHTGGTSPVVTWTSAQAWPQRGSSWSDAGRSRSWQVIALPGYVDAFGGDVPLQLPDPSLLPGWDPAWSVELPVDDWRVSLVEPTDDGHREAVWNVLAAGR